MRRLAFGVLLVGSLTALVAPTFAAKPKPAPPAPAPAAAPAPAPGAPSASQVVKYRQSIMDAAAGHMGALALIAKGQSDRTADVALHANALRDLATTVGALFPAGSGPSTSVETEAKPEIWTDQARFAEVVKAFEAETTKLAEVAATGDLEAFKSQFGAVGGSCGDCHDAFKIDEDHH
jgi:cytochrome c556